MTICSSGEGYIVVWRYRRQLLRIPGPNRHRQREDDTVLKSWVCSALVGFSISVLGRGWAAADAECNLRISIALRPPGGEVGGLYAFLDIRSV